MRTRMVEERIGENTGPIDWDDPIAKGMLAKGVPAHWRGAEQKPEEYTFNGKEILALAMYDGWPYWKPKPAIQFSGPLGPEWTFFNGYGVWPGSIMRK